MFNLNKKTTALKSEMLDKIAEYEDIIGTIKNEQIKHSYEKDLIKFQEIISKKYIKGKIESNKLIITFAKIKN